MADVRPGPNESKPYVAIGPSKDLSITVHKNTFDSLFIAFTILIGVSLFIIVGLIVFFAYERAKLPPPPPPLKSNPNNPTLHANVGAAVSATAPLRKRASLPEDGSAFRTEQECYSVSNTTWIEDHCECKAPFFGPTCVQEKHDPKYFAVGTPETINATILQEKFAIGKSFTSHSTQETCSFQCNQNPKCVGFLYNPQKDSGICTLLTGDVIVPSGLSIPYSYDQESTLYMQSSNNLHFEDRIFLGGFKGAIPPRFWLVKEQNQYIQLVPYEIAALKFVPTFTKIYGFLTGIYCRHAFTADDIDILLERGDTSECYIHRPDHNINLPPDWQYHNQQLYVVYV